MMKTKFVGLAMIAGLLIFVFGSAFAMVPAQTNTSSTLQQSTKSAAWTGWSEVPGNGLTLSGPGVTVYYGTLYVFVRGTDNRIYQNRLTYYNGWTGWSQVPGNGFTPSNPGATVFGNSLFLFVRGTDNRIYQNLIT